MPEAQPFRPAMLESAGWTLQDAEATYEAGDEPYWLPDRWARAHLEPGYWAKLVFLVRSTPPGGEARVESERMWVEVLTREGERYRGRLGNQPHTPGPVREGMELWFGPEHVVDIADLQKNVASRHADLISCDTHGLSEICHVCEHLVGGTTRRGFNTAANAEGLRPDAWCDQCDQLLDEFPGWDDVPAERHPGISVLCGGCYDAARARNLTAHRSFHIHQE